MEVRTDILHYVEGYILPQYAYFDAAHNLAHVQKVIQNSMALCADYPALPQMVYVIAAYHDIGLCKGREHHEKHSALALLADPKLPTWFNAEEIQIMAQAVEDHRASRKQAPRSLYGCIVAEADRDISYSRILRRTIQYGLHHEPHLDQEQHFQRIHRHLCEKYGEGGYLKLWLNSGENARNLQLLRAKLQDPAALRADFDSLFQDCRQNQQTTVS